MMFRRSVILAVAGVLALGAFAPVSAQPAAPPRPSYSPYLSYTPNWGSGFYGYGLGGNTWSGRAMQFQQQQQQNQMLQQQSLAYNQSLANLQNLVAYGINPNLSITGRGSTFNYLGHWYPSSRYGGGGGFGGGVGSFAGMGGSRFGGMSGMGSAIGGGAGLNAAPPRTAGSGIPVGPGGFRR